MAFAALANGGSLYAPRVVLAMQDPSGRRIDTGLTPDLIEEIPWTESQHKVLMDGFRGVVEDTRRGTGRHAGFDPSMRVAGKTGSAQYTAAEGAQTHAWFVCFSPWDAPEVCVTVLIEKAGHGGEVAAPLAKNILDNYYALKAAREEGKTVHYNETLVPLDLGTTIPLPLDALDDATTATASLDLWLRPGLGDEALDPEPAEANG